MVLLGLTGSGRSSCGNTILGRSEFWTDVSPVSVTSRCQRSGGVVDGRSLRVIDTPGFFHTCLSPDDVRAELNRCVELSAPGPQVFLLVLRAGRVTRESLAALDWISAAFGPQALSYTVVLITCGDALGAKPAADFLKESEELWEFVCSCAGGFEERSQVTELLKKIDLLMERNAGAHYTADMLLQADTAVCHMQQRILGDDHEEDEEAKKGAERLFW
ncbi:GTPase IMAP family member 9 [Labeo rohita]|uniref:GTPase IMAP family member 9 n=1 Tax=Labeo rohita TaxID=84645 RepID=A0ABQ8MW37_LABRO|nr:GTPase IMAP family member 9 [Labeo rohita]